MEIKQVKYNGKTRILVIEYTDGSKEVFTGIEAVKKFKEIQTEN